MSRMAVNMLKFKTVRASQPRHSPAMPLVGPDPELLNPKKARSIVPGEQSIDNGPSLCYKSKIICLHS